MNTSLLLPAVVFAPLLAAVIATMAPARTRPILGGIGAGTTAIVTVAVVATIAEEGVVDSELAGRAAPLGITLRADGASAIFLLTGAVIGLSVSVHALLNPRSTGGDHAGPWFWPLWLLTWTGLNAMFVTGDLFNTYVALEILALGAVALIAQGGSASWTAAFRYLIVAVVGSLLFLLAVTLIYAATGTLDIALAGEYLATADGSDYTSWVLALTAGGMALKTALFPVHGWLPDAHSTAPGAVSPLLSALVVKASFYVLARVWFDVTGPEAAVGTVLGALGAASVLWAGLLALRGTGLKRIVAYSTISQIGYLFLVFPLTAAAGDDDALVRAAWIATALFVMGHALSKASLFLAAGTLKDWAGSDRLSDLRGIGLRTPMTAMTVGLASVGLAGLPISLGFVAKWQLMTVAVRLEAWWCIGLVLAGSVLAAVYLLRPVQTMIADVSARPSAQRLPMTAVLVPLTLALISTAAMFAIGPLEELAVAGWGGTR